MYMAFLGALLGVMITQFTLLWYKLGRLEGQLQKLNDKHREGSND